mmetsp:Transcript_2044/g.7065  ORF Transcript_2044/g.7065 Transcript_2044/m.7065 type:complete len:216 (+) Transcript_2044:1223-1870(+)
MTTFPSHTSYLTDIPSSTTSHFPWVPTSFSKSTRSRWWKLLMSRCSACLQNAQNSSPDWYKDLNAVPFFIPEFLALHTSLIHASAPCSNSTLAIKSGSPFGSLEVSSTQIGAKESSRESASQNGKYGFISSTGVSSTKSAPSTSRTPCFTSTERILHKLMPTGLGRCGERVASTPLLSPFSRGTRTFERDVVRFLSLSPPSSRKPPIPTCRSVFL